ncbi:2'-5' RNA ligase family protein [Oculatella sp. LEGE 06141]|uniref:2'-5' RNA ligase family protein n=1 Tax=Oculatella sp. LEGE 06141 TaxID=1828648 RepID=UPI001880AF2A|nr:2'-5' RNA ligase family protein [Oculatella sp. LEGE 06141]MBE9181842.1 2'-5' RNA ligase family protein [Oculatella sp. LEGE 06141]
MTSENLDQAHPRFFIALLPPQAIQEYADGVIQELSDRYHTRTAKAPPHVTLQPPFRWSLEAIATLEDCLYRFATEQMAVPITLAGFGAFAPRVLYINVLKTTELLTLQASLMLRLEQTLAIVDPVAKRRPFAPHMTVASRNLTRSIFKQAWTELQQRRIEFQFVGDRLTLLIHDGHRWHIRSEFPLLNPVG